MSGMVLIYPGYQNMVDWSGYTRLFGASVLDVLNAEHNTTQHVVMMQSVALQSTVAFNIVVVFLQLTQQVSPH